MRRTIPIALLALLLDASARADVVPPEPTNCPPGSVGRTCHGGPYCGVPAPCTSSTSCTGGMTCQTVQLCVVKHDCDGKIGPNYVDSVKGTCAGGAACSVGTCQTVQVCIPTAPKPDAKVPPLDAKVPPLDAKVPPLDAKVPPLDAKAPVPDVKRSPDAAGTPASRGCSCALEPDGAAAGAPLGLLFAAAVLLGCRRRRSRP